MYVMFGYYDSFMQDFIQFITEQAKIFILMKTRVS